MQMLKRVRTPFNYTSLSVNSYKYFSSERKLAEELAAAFESLKIGHNPGAIVDVKNDVVMFRTPSDPSLQYYRLVQSTENPDVQGLVVSMKDTISSALLLGSEKNISVGEELRSTGQPLKVPVDLQRSGKILDYKSRNMNQTEELHTAELQPLFHKPQEFTKQKRTHSGGQLYTGSIVVDLAEPISLGSFAFFKGNANTGKTFLSISAMHQFLKSNILSKRSVSMRKVIYVNINNNATQTVAKHLEELGVLKDAFLFTSKMGMHRSSEDYLLPYSALLYAQELKRQGYDILFVFDEFQVHHLKEIMLFNTAKVPVAPYNIINELFQESGYFERGSMTSILISDSNTVTAQQLKEVQHREDWVSSLANVTLNFDMSDVEFRKEFPKINLKVTTANYKWRHALVNYISQHLALLNNAVQAQKNVIIQRKQFKLQVDPWDAYLYHDSKYFMKILITSNRYDIVEQVILVQMVLRAIETDSISYFKEEPMVLITDIFRFISEYKEFEQKDIYTYIQVLLNRDLPEEEVTQTIIQSINRFYEMFQVWCRVNNKLLQFKKDYTN